MALTIFLVSSIVYPQKQVQAIGFAGVIPAGITVGAGTYAITALAVGSVATAVGIEYGDEINSHAGRVWDSGSQLAKDSLNASINAAVGLGNGVVNLGSDFLDWLNGEIPKIAHGIAGITTNHSYYNKTIVQQTDTRQIVQFSGFDILANGVKVSNSIIYVEVNDSVKIASVRINGKNVFTGMNDGLYEGAKAIALSDPFSILQKANSNPLSQYYGTTLTLNTSSNVEYGTAYNNAVSSLREEWETMRDAGLVLPVDSATAYSGDVYMDKANADGTYTGIDGNIYNPADLQWSFPTAKNRVATGDIPAGVYTDSPALTGNPVIDKALTNNPAIPKTTTNVTTGETFANPDIAGDIPAEGFWAKLWEWLQKILNAILAIPKAILSGLSALFVPTVALGTLFAPFTGALGDKFNTPGELAYIKGQTVGPGCSVDDLKINLFGKQITIVDISFIKNASSWYLPIFKGLLWFFFGWYLYRKIVALINSNGGIKY